MHNDMIDCRHFNHLKSKIVKVPNNLMAHGPTRSKSGPVFHISKLKIPCVKCSNSLSSFYFWFFIDINFLIFCPFTKISMGWDYCSYQQRRWSRGGEHVLPLWKGRWQSYVFCCQFWKLHPPCPIQAYTNFWSSPKTCSPLTGRSFSRPPPPPPHTHFPIHCYSAGYDISMSLISTSHQFLTTTLIHNIAAISAHFVIWIVYICVCILSILV